MPKTQKPHTEKFYQRVDAVVLLILSNDRYLESKRGNELKSNIMAQLKCSSRQAERYLAEAIIKVNEMVTIDRENALRKARIRKAFLWQKTLGSFDNSGKVIIEPDYKLALEVDKEICKMEGLYVEKIDHTVKFDVKKIDTTRLTDEQLAQLKKMVKNKCSEEEVAFYLKSIGMI